MPEEDDPDLQLRSRAGFGGARSRSAQPDQRGVEDVADTDNGEDQQVVREEEAGSNFIDRDKFVLVGLACITFNIVWFLGGWLLANILFGVAIIRFMNSVRLVEVIYIYLS